MNAVLPPYADPMQPVPDAGALGRVHLIGIGGVGMSGIARILLARGSTVSGSDAQDSPALTALRALGARVAVGHAAGHLGDADTVVVSTAVRADNPELLEAARRGLPVLARAAALASLMAGRRAVAVAGTHGKTSTTSMLTLAARHCGADPSFAVGGDLSASGANAHHGSGPEFFAEADESDGSFLLLSPYAGVVTNIEADHLDNYRDLDAVRRAFAGFVETIDTAGFLVLCADDADAAALAVGAVDRGLRTRTYGESGAADLRLSGVQVSGAATSYDAALDGAALGRITVGAPGRHMALNSAAALLTGVELGLPAAGLSAGLAGYTGVRRRFELKGEVGGVRVYDDYAHHPTEITAQLRAARIVAAPGRLIAAFQPHLYSRTRAFAADFGVALALADEVVVMEIYGAREDPMVGVSGALVAEAVPLPVERVRFEPDRAAVAPALAARSRPGDLVLTLGAGDVSMIGPEVLAVLAERER